MRWLFLYAALSALLAAPTYAADEKCTLKRYAVMPFAVDGTAHIILPATLGGKPSKLMLDTGAYWSMINQEVVEDLGLRTKSSMYIDMRDLAGNKIDKLAVVPEVKVGQLNYGPAEFFVGGKAGVPMAEDGGLLGQNLLTQVDLEIDNANRKVSFFSQDHCKGDGVYWADEAVTLEFKREKGRVPLGTRVRQEVDKNQIDPPIVKADLEGAPIEILFDTGATNSAMDVGLARSRFGIDINSPGVQKSGKVVIASGEIVDTHSYTFKTLTIAGIKFENVPIRLMEFGNPGKMILGMNEMKHLRLYFAFKEGLIHVTAANATKQQVPQQK